MSRIQLEGAVSPSPPDIVSSEVVIDDFPIGTHELDIPIEVESDDNETGVDVFSDAVEVLAPSIRTGNVDFTFAEPCSNSYVLGQAFGRYGPISPILYPGLGNAFDNPAALPDKTLYLFQVKGVLFLINCREAILADEMGLGKTIQAIVAMRYLFHHAKIRNALVICPKNILNNWSQKLAEWAPELKIIKVAGDKKERERLWRQPAHVHLSAYDTIVEDITNRIDWHLIILDEAQIIKNQKTLRHQAVSLNKGKIKWGLSGTPLENSVNDLISIFSYLKPGLLRKKDRDHKKIRRKLRSRLLRRKKSDVLPDLPEKMINESWIDLTESQRKLYEQAERQGIAHLKNLGSRVTVKHALALITELKLICNMNQHTMESSKFDFLESKLCEIPVDDKVLVFSQFPNKTLRPIMSRFKRRCLLYDASVSIERREEIIELFRDEDYKVLFISLKSGGLGLDLSMANYVFHFDVWWNPAVTAQAEDRVHRIGQKKTVFVTYLYTPNTIEERVYELVKQKRELFDVILGDLSAETVYRKLSKEDILGLFQIRMGK